MMDATCLNPSCGGPATLNCSRCQGPYCSTSCQKKHWKKHKVYCVPVAVACEGDESPTDFSQVSSPIYLTNQPLDEPDPFPDQAHLADAARRVVVEEAKRLGVDLLDHSRRYVKRYGRGCYMVRFATLADMSMDPPSPQTFNDHLTDQLERAGRVIGFPKSAVKAMAKNPLNRRKVEPYPEASLGKIVAWVTSASLVDQFDDPGNMSLHLLMNFDPDTHFAMSGELKVGLENDVVTATSVLAKKDQDNDSLQFAKSVLPLMKTVVHSTTKGELTPIEKAEAIFREAEECAASGDFLSALDRYSEALPLVPEPEVISEGGKGKKSLLEALAAAESAKAREKEKMEKDAGGRSEDDKDAIAKRILRHKLLAGRAACKIKLGQPGDTPSDVMTPLC